MSSNRNWKRILIITVFQPLIFFIFFEQDKFTQPFEATWSTLLHIASSKSVPSCGTTELPGTTNACPSSVSSCQPRTSHSFCIHTPTDRTFSRKEQPRMFLHFDDRWSVHFFGTRACPPKEFLFRFHPLADDLFCKLSHHSLRARFSFAYDPEVVLPQYAATLVFPVSSPTNQNPAPRASIFPVRSLSIPVARFETILSLEVLHLLQQCCHNPPMSKAVLTSRLAKYIVLCLRAPCITDSFPCSCHCQCFRNKVVINTWCCDVARFRRDDECARCCRPLFFR